MSITNIILSGLLVAMLLILSPNLRQIAMSGIGLWTWALSLIISGAVGEFVGVWFGRNMLRGHFFEPGFLQTLIFAYGIVVCAAVLTFFISNRVIAFFIFSFLERSRKVELTRPSTILGLCFAAISPFAIDFIISAFRSSK